MNSVSHIENTQLTFIIITKGKMNFLSMNKITRLVQVKFNQVSVVLFCFVTSLTLELHLKLEQEAYKIITQIVKISTFQFYIVYLERYRKGNGIRVKDTNFR